MPAGGSTLTRLDEHPTVRKVQGRAAPEPEPVLDSGTLLRECLELGADDAGFVEIERPEIADQREEILALLPRAQTLISFLVRMNREAIRSPARSLANVEFHH